MDLTALFGGSTGQLIIMVGIFVVFYMLLIMPQKKKEKKLKQALAALKLGDKITTIGGFVGKICKIKGDTVTFECGPEKVKLNIVRSAISTVNPGVREPKNIPAETSEEDDTEE